MQLMLFGRHVHIADLDQDFQKNWLTFDPGLRKSAVCLLFIPSPDGQVDEPHVVFTKRSTQVRTHKGQMGLPGGISEAGENSPVVTALRELEEEIGVSKENMEVHGLLPMQMSIGAFPVFCVVMSTQVHPKDFRISPSEVAEIVLLPVSELRRECSKGFRFNIFGKWRESHLFTCSAHKIWGLTANIIYSADLRLSE